MMQAFGVLAARRQQKKMTKVHDRTSGPGQRPIFNHSPKFLVVSVTWKR